MAPYPFGCFYEEGLDHALTCVSIVLPEQFYNDAARKTAERIYTFSTADLDVEADLNGAYTCWELELIQRKSRCKLI